MWCRHGYDGPWDYKDDYQGGQQDRQQDGQKNDQDKHQDGQKVHWYGQDGHQIGQDGAIGLVRMISNIRMVFRWSDFQSIFFKIHALIISLFFYNL